MRGQWIHNKTMQREFREWLSDICDEELLEYRFFTIVRNPWDRAVSIAAYFKRDVADFAKNHQRLVKSNRTLAQHALPLHRYSHLNGDRFIDLAGRFETLQEDFDALCDELKLARQQLPHRNRTEHGNYSELLDDETRRLIGEIYQRDIELFGYKF